MSADTDGDAERDGWIPLSRRAFLALAGGGVGAASMAHGTLDDDGASGGGASVGLGDNAGDRVREAWGDAALYFAPRSAPPARSEVLWLYNDVRPDLDVPNRGSLGELAHDAVPTTWTANGLGWSVAADVATAKSNLPTQPGIAASTAGAMVVTYSSGLPLTGGSDVRWVIASSRSAAESAWSGTTPAVLWSASGDAVAKLG